MSHLDTTQLIDRVITRRKDRLRVLYALFLAREKAPGMAVKESTLLRRLACEGAALTEAIAALEAAGFVRRAGTDSDAAIELLPAGLFAAETALLRLDRETGDFPPLRSVLNSDLELAPERRPGEKRPPEEPASP